MVNGMNKYELQYRDYRNKWTTYSEHLFLFSAKRSLAKKILNIYNSPFWRIVKDKNVVHMLFTSSFPGNKFSNLIEKALDNAECEYVVHLYPWLSYCENKTYTHRKEDNV